MTVNEYISQKFQTFGINLSEADLLDMCFSVGMMGNDCMYMDVYDKINVAIAKFIPSLLLRATSISESGFSMSWNLEGIKQYYSFLCKRYGLSDELNTDKPKVHFL